MKTKIFYFSGTGNSLAAARQIAEHIDAELVSIPAAMQSLRLSADDVRIGVVFPSYLAPIAGLPHIVLRFIQNIPAIESRTIFSVCTCGGYASVNALPALQAFKKAVTDAGGHCRAAYPVRMPMNNLDYAHIPIPIVTDTEKIIAKSRRVICRVGRQIAHNGKTRFPAAKAAFLWMMRPVFALIAPLAVRALREAAGTEADGSDVYSLMPLTDKRIDVNDRCTECGICVQVCPVGNIRLAGGKPVFMHKCEMCFACDEWCPAGVIHHWSRKEDIKYHHPDITLKNMLEYKSDKRV